MVDVETTPIRPRSKPRTKFWGLAIEGEGYRRFETTADLMAALSQEQGLRLFCWHDFDVVQALKDGHVPADLKVRGSRVIRATLGGCEWINGYALFPTSLAKLLESYGAKKLPLGLEGHQLGCECKGCDDALSRRNQSDCIDGLAALLDAGASFEKVFGLDPVREGYATAASASFAVAQRVAGPLPAYSENREAYRGGRTEAFWTGELGAVEQWDICSSYPFAFVDLPEVDTLLKLRVRVHARPEPRPFFLDSRTEDRFLFPAGVFTTYVFESNLQRYIEPHGGYNVERVIWRKPIDFGWLKNVVPLIHKGYALKKRGGALAYPAKIFLNSLYGRLGLKETGQIAQFVDSAPDKLTGVTCYRCPDGRKLIFREVYLGGRGGANYLFAAAITDNARGRLYDALRKAQSPFYCDTDSVFCPIGGFGQKKSSDVLGGWKREGEGELRIRSVKDYEFGGIVKRKGGDRNTIWTIKLALAGKPVQSIKKHRVTRYDKRHVLGDGSTMPLIIR